MIQENILEIKKLVDSQNSMGIYGSVELELIKIEEKLKFELFSFSKYLVKWFDYYDTCRGGDIYKQKATKEVFTEDDIYKSWRKIKLH